MNFSSSLQESYCIFFSNWYLNMENIFWGYNGIGLLFSISNELYRDCCMFWLFLLWFFYQWVWSLSPLHFSLHLQALLVAVVGSQPFPLSHWQSPLLAKVGPHRAVRHHGECYCGWEHRLRSRTTSVQTLALPNNKLNAPGKATFLQPVLSFVKWERCE